MDCGKQSLRENEIILAQVIDTSFPWKNVGKGSSWIDKMNSGSDGGVGGWRGRF